MTHDSQSRHWFQPWAALALILVVGFTIRLVDLNRQGETWDEVAYYDAGYQYFNNLQHRDFNADHWNANREHPPVGKYVYMLASLNPYQTNTSNAFGPGRMASAIMGMLTVLVTFLIGRRLVNDRVGLLAAVTLATLPIFVGLNLVLGLDTPTAFTCTLTVWLFLKAVERRSHWFYLASALMAGLAIATRLSNLLVLPTLLVIWIIFRWPHRQGSRDKQDSRFQIPDSGFRWTELLHVATFAIVPFLTVFMVWPWLWASNWRDHLDSTIGHWSPVVVVFLGKIQIAPPSYYFVYLLAVIPGAVLAVLVWFIWRALRTRRTAWLVVLAWLLIPFAFSFFGTRQGGFRYLLQVTPAIALGVGLVLDELMARLALGHRIVLTTAFLVYLVIQLIGIRPYYLDYYNEFVGGPKTVASNRWFQIGWWNEGTEATVTWFNGHAEPGSTVAYLAIPDRSKRLLWDDFSVVGLDQARYVITNPNAEWFALDQYRLSDFRPIYEERAFGAPIAIVLERKY